MSVEILENNFNPYQYLEQLNLNKDSGAESIFIGHMRSNKNTGQAVSKMLIEHYPEMTLKSLQAIVNKAKTKYQIHNALIAHRVGEVLPGQAIVLIACWSTHREASINASRFLIEALKSEVPFWKKEWRKDKEQWVDKNTTAYYE